MASRLFGSQRDSRQKTEIVLSITPHIVRNLRRPNLIDSEFSSGTENKSKFTQSLKKIPSIDSENKSLKKDTLKDARKDEFKDSLTAVKKQATSEISKNELNVKIKAMVQDKIKVNEPFFIDIMINDIKGLDAIPIEIITDPQKLYFLNATLGSSITEYQPAMNQLMLPDGKILISLSQLDKIQSNAESKKDFMNIVRLNFKPLSEGEATLKVLTANPITKYKINSLDISPMPKLIIEP